LISKHWQTFCTNEVVQELLPLLHHNFSILFIAPPGWGKTRMLLQLIYDSHLPWVFISPLRALANEFYLSVTQKIKNCYVISSKTEMQQLIASEIEFKLLIVTPEVYGTQILKQKVIYVWDEFHLTYYWGDTFREKLLELYYHLVYEQVPMLSLTATMSESHMVRWKQEMALNYARYSCLNVANQKLKNNPVHYFYYPLLLKRKLWHHLALDLNDAGTVLLFCPYRQQVDELVQYYQGLGYRALGCKGGETKEFSQQLVSMKEVDLIIATTAISHGVNLPCIRTIYFSYPVKNRDFWIQMVGRGGRKGEDFSVHTMDFEPECGKKWKVILKTYFLGMYLRVKKLRCMLKE
jgi:ATP-dependent DNA helicase RecQ